MSSAPYPLLNGFSLQDANFITEEITYRNLPARDLVTQKLSRRSGSKLTATDFAEREVTIKGAVVANPGDDLQTLIDNFNRNVTNKDSVSFYVSARRYGTATVKSVGIGDAHYNQDYVPIEISLLMVDPFFYEPQQTVTYTIASGTTIINDTITISGSSYAQPIITYTAPTGIGYTTTSGISVRYNATTESITWSGVGSHPTLSYGSSITFDYDNHRVLQGVAEVDADGVFSRWDCDAEAFQVTFSGMAMGGTLNFSYQPRYL